MYRIGASLHSPVKMLLMELEDRQGFEKNLRESAEERWESMRKQMTDEAEGLRERQQVGSKGFVTYLWISILVISQSLCVLLGGKLSHVSRTLLGA